MDVIARIAQELAVRSQQVSATVALLDEGATVPFIARYRKEVTGNLDDTQLRFLAERLGYLRELNDRRETVLNSIATQAHKNVFYIHIDEKKDRLVIKQNFIVFNLRGCTGFAAIRFI